MLECVRCAACPADFTYIAPVNGCYKPVIRRLNWADAGQECRSLHKDAHLLVINDAQEQSAVADMLGQFPVSVLSLSYLKTLHSFRLSVVVCVEHQ